MGPGNSKRGPGRLFRLGVHPEGAGPPSAAAHPMIGGRTWVHHLPPKLVLELPQQSCCLVLFCGLLSYDLQCQVGAWGGEGGGGHVGEVPPLGFVSLGTANLSCSSSPCTLAQSCFARSRRCTALAFSLGTPPGGRRTTMSIGPTSPGSKAAPPTTAAPPPSPSPAALPSRPEIARLPQRCQLVPV
jgi:hypothetical protein